MQEAILNEKDQGSSCSEEVTGLEFARVRERGMPVLGSHQRFGCAVPTVPAINMLQ